MLARSPESLHPRSLQRKDNIVKTLKILCNSGFFLLLAQQVCASMPKVTAFAAEIWADGTTDYGVLVASEQVLFADK